MIIEMTQVKLQKIDPHQVSFSTCHSGNWPFTNLRHPLEPKFNSTHLWLWRFLSRMRYETSVYIISASIPGREWIGGCHKLCFAHRGQPALSAIRHVNMARAWQGLQCYQVVKDLGDVFCCRPLQNNVFTVCCVVIRYNSCGMCLTGHRSVPRSIVRSYNKARYGSAEWTACTNWPRMCKIFIVQSCETFIPRPSQAAPGVHRLKSGTKGQHSSSTRGSISWFRDRGSSANIA